MLLTAVFVGLVLLAPNVITIRAYVVAPMVIKFGVILEILCPLTTYVGTLIVSFIANGVEPAIDVNVACGIKKSVCPFLNAN